MACALTIYAEAMDPAPRTPMEGDTELAQAAEASARPFAGILGPDLLTQVKLAHIAIWLAQQDGTVSASSIVRCAQQAVYDIHAGIYAAN